MDERSLKAMQLIFRESGIEPKELAGRLGVGERSVRTYVSRANEELAPVARIEKHRGDGYELKVLDESEFAERFERVLSGAAHGVPSTPAERISYLVNDLLSRDGWITLDELAEMLFVSRNAISSNLKQVEERLARFDLVLERRPHYGIRVIGPEMSRRLCLANEVLRGYERADEHGGASMPSLDRVAACIEGPLSASGISINAGAYQNLLVHISIAVKRIREGCYLSVDGSPDCAGDACRAHGAAQSIADAVEQAFDIRLPEEEVSYIGLHIAGKQSLYEPLEDTRSDSASLVISDEVWNVVAEMLDVVWCMFRFDFRHDLELRMNLARHIVPLSVRLRYHMSLENPLLADTKMRFPMAYSMAQDASSVLFEHYGSKPSEDEVGYIALAFALALERLKTGLPKKRILVVCASGQGSAKLLEWRYRQEFGAYIDTVTTCDVGHLGSIDFSKIDYVFTTVPIGHALPVPVREVRFFFDDADARMMRDLLGAHAPASGLARYFDPRLFVAHIDATDKWEVLDTLCDLVERVRTVSPDLRALVRRREESAPTSFGNNVAMPHPLQAVTDETFVCVGILDRPIQWNEWAEAQAVFLVCVAREWGEDLRVFYEGMTTLFTSKRAIDSLLKHQNWETLCSLLDAKDEEGGGRPWTT